MPVRLSGPIPAEQSIVRKRISDGRRAMLARRSDEERRLLAEIKRLIERCRGDASFLEEMTAGPERSRAAATRCGLTIDPQQALPLFAAMADDASEPDYAAAPLARLWHDFSEDLRALWLDCREIGACPQASPPFDAWRNRQIRRCDCQLGRLGRDIIHSLVAFELSAGCSVGCWFCGISADRFRGHFPYTPANAELWRGMLGEVVDLFGTAAASGFCYWGTDPCDNPDYPEFMRDFADATGALPPTTTAIPLKDVALTRRILALEQAYGYCANRFSILNLKMLDRVHAEFSAEELFDVELVLQNPEAATPRAFAGRARTRRPAIRAEAEAKRSADDMTIACVTGFLVNMVERTVRLITPVPASERWPLGYRTFETRTFQTGAEFGQAMREMIDRHMPTAPASGNRLRFRPDLTYRSFDDGFEVTSRSTRFALSGSPAAALLGELVASGESAPREIQARLIGAGANVFSAIGWIQQLFDRGLLDDDQDVVTEPHQDAVVAVAAE